MGVVNQAVQDAVGDSRIADLLMPARDWQLGREQGGASLVPVLADFPDIASLGFTRRFGGEQALD